MIEPACLAVVTLESHVENLSPFRIRRNPGSIGIDLIPINFSTSGIDVDLVRSNPSLALPRVSDKPEKENHRSREILLEKSLGRAHSFLTGGRRDCRVELRSS